MTHLVVGLILIGTGAVALTGCWRCLKIDRDFEAFLLGLSGFLLVEMGVWSLALGDGL